MERRERFQAHGVSPFQKRQSVKIEAEPQGVRRASSSPRGSWLEPRPFARRNVHGDKTAVYGRVPLFGGVSLPGINHLIKCLP